MPTFSKASLAKLNTCHSDLQRLFLAVIEEYDCTIICGYRGEAEQNKAYSERKSKFRFPNGKHNKKPSLAVDVVPYPINWIDIDRFIEMSKIVKRIACELDIKIRWGGDWKRFPDYPHYELAE